MPLYTVRVTVQLDAATEYHAYRVIERVIETSRLGKLIEHIDSEVIDTQPDEPPNDEANDLGEYKR